MEHELSGEDDIQKLRTMAGYIRSESINGRLVEINALKDVVDMEADDIQPLMERLMDFPEFIVLKSVSDENGTIYWYSGNDMTDRYVHILVGLKQKNLVAHIAEMVRYESKTYPRPTRVDLFLEKPYSVGYETLDEMLGSLSEGSAYRDLKFTQASNGVTYLYSDRYLTGFYAAKLAEWHAVLQYETP
jgi:hypothetical protein